VLRLGGVFDDRQDEDSRRDEYGHEPDVVALAVADDGVAEVEARDQAARRVELQHAPHVEREVRLALRAEQDDGDGDAAEGLLGAAELLRRAEADEAGPRLGEEAEGTEALSHLHPELRLQCAPARRDGQDRLVREEVALGLDGDVRVEVESKAPAEADVVGRPDEVFRVVERERRVLRPDLEPRDTFAFGLRRVLLLLRLRGRGEEQGDGDGVGDATTRGSFHECCPAAAPASTA
jgi:hypothetical protein